MLFIQVTSDYLGWKEMLITALLIDMYSGLGMWSDRATNAASGCTEALLFWSVIIETPTTITLQVHFLSEDIIHHIMTPQKVDRRTRLTSILLEILPMVFTA
ncbi:hypothetical protein ACJX0J_008102 [Zea mays]